MRRTAIVVILGRVDLLCLKRYRLRLIKSCRVVTHVRCVLDVCEGWLDRSRRKWSHEEKMSPVPGAAAWLMTERLRLNLIGNLLLNQ